MRVVALRRPAEQGRRNASRATGFTVLRLPSPSPRPLRERALDSRTREALFPEARQPSIAASPRR